MNKEPQPFLDLPTALVEEVLGQASAAGDLLLDSFKKVKADRETYRKSLHEIELLLDDSHYGYPPVPTTCGTDGSYAIERLLTTDLAAAGSVAVEGLTPPSEKRHWPQPRHLPFVKPEIHHDETATILRSVMLGSELLLAVRAPHELVMIDGTLTLPIIYFNQALNAAPDLSKLRCSEEFLGHCIEYLEAYNIILHAQRSDKNYIGLPKYSTRREIGSKVGWPGHHDDRGLLTMLLKPGELTKPMTLEEREQDRWHLDTNRLPNEIRDQVDKITPGIIDGLKNVHVFYYKPHEWLPALRIEVAQDIAKNPYRLGSVLQGLKHQCATPSMLEPYPIYMADRMAKALARSLPAFRQVATQRISEQYEGDIGEVFFAMHGYRSESGGKSHG